MGTFERYRSRAFPETHKHNQRYTVFVDMLISQQNFRKTSIQISDGENSLMRKFWWKIFFVGFLIMKKVYIIWSHELIEKLDFYGLFYCYGVIFSCFSWNSQFRVIIKNNYSSCMWLCWTIPWSFMMKYIHF